jgi:hypothetical protein
MSTEVEREFEEVSLFDKDGNLTDAPTPVEAPKAAQSAPEKDTETFVMPEKFAGKTIEDVVRAYQNVESALGNKSNEVGELRKLTDQILLNQSAVPQHPVEAADINDDVGFDDFIDDPAAAVNKALDSNPRLQKLEKSLETNAANADRKALLDALPDADEIVASQEFQTWVKEMPVRGRILQDAHVNRDVAAAVDLIGMYKSTSEAATENAIEERDAIAKGELKQATVVKGGVPNTKKPVYKRTELIALRVSNPAAYAARAPEFNLAYAEKRVK